jgi:hypothetical protein
MKSFFEKINIEKDDEEEEYFLYQLKYNLISDEEIIRNIDSYDSLVREIIAAKGICLDILVHDDDWFVRIEVARHGYMLDILVVDDDEHVRHEAEYQLKIRGLL